MPDESSPETTPGTSNERLIRAARKMVDGDSGLTFSVRVDSTQELGVRCPQCGRLFQLSSHEEWSNIQCSACGIRFDLIQEVPVPSEVSHPALGHFELLQRIGRGAFGDVWRARDTHLDRVVAVKLPRKSQLERHEAEQFFREARAAAQLKHPHIVSVHEAGRFGDQIYIVSDLVEGATLKEWMSARRPTFRETAEVCMQLADALHHAHERGVIHRDLKPANVMLTQDGQAKVMDFGLARREFGELTMTHDGQILGTPAYMSPEQARGASHQADRRSDIYSLGVILFELLTGERPFRGSLRIVLGQVLHDDAPSPRKLNTAISRDLATICLTCLEREPKKRYQTAAEVADELRRFLAGLPIKARRIGPLERGWRWCRRRPAVAGLLAALALALTGGYVAITAQLLRVETARTLADAEGRRARIALGQLREQSLRTRQSLYVADMRSMDSEWDEGNLSRVAQLLDRHAAAVDQTDVRTWSWYYWWKKSHPYAALLRHSQAVSRIAFSPDGIWLASLQVGQSDPRKPTVLSLWDRQSGSLVRRIELDSFRCSVFLWSPDSKYLLADRGGVVQGWDVAIGKVAFQFTGNPTQPDSIPYGPAAAAFSPDGEELAISCEMGVSLWHWPSRSFNELLLLKRAGPTARPRPIAYSPDGEFLAVTDSEPGKIVLWKQPSDPARRKRLTLSLPDRQDFRWVVFTPDSQELWSVRENGAVQAWVRHAEDDWRAATLDEQWRLKVARNAALTCTPDNQEILYGGDQRRIWRWNRKRRQFSEAGLFHGEPVLDIALTPDGKLAASSDGKGNVALWPVAQGSEQVPALTGNFHRLALSPDGRRLATLQRRGNNITLGVWDLPSRQPRHQILAHQGQPQALAFSPDGGRLASAARDGVVKLWDVHSGALVQSWAEVEARYGQTLAIAPDGATVAVLAIRQGLLLLDVATGSSQPAPQEMKQCFHPLMFDLQGNLMLQRGRNLEVWDLQSQQRVREFRGAEAAPSTMAFSPDGALLVSGHMDRRICVWNAADASLIRTLHGNRDSVWSLAISPDGLTLASGGGDVRLWSLTTFESIGSFDYASVIGFSADQRDLVVSRSSGLALLTAATPPQVEAFDHQSRSGPTVVLEPRELRLQPAD